MNDSPSADHGSCQALQRNIDRLVDGECGWDEAQTVLEQLERTPDGWRRLALTFLESQTLERELGTARAASRLASVTPAVVPAPNHASSASSRRLPAWVGQALCLSAALLLGFVLGQNGWNHKTATDTPNMASAPPSAPQSAPQPSEERPADSVSPSTVAKAGTSSKDSSSVAVSSGESLSMLVSDPQTSEVREVKLPLVRADGADSTTWQTASSPVPETVRAALERLGQEVHVERKLYPVMLGDGRTVVLPIDDVEVRSANRPRYQ